MYEFNARKAADACIQWIRDWFEENGKGCNAVIGISGGKDSTVVAGLCAKALGPERVIGVMLPDGVQPDIQDSRDVIEALGIHGVEYNIKDATDALLDSMTGLSELAHKLGFKDVPSQQSRENLPPRIRMSALYLIAQSFNGRVSNNCNLSENWIGYSTIYGDTAGDFAPISSFTASEVIAIGRAIGIPERFLVKAPSDGLCGKTDEDKLGFTYAVLDRYLREGVIEDMAVKGCIDGLHNRNKFKHEPMKAFQWGRLSGLKAYTVEWHACGYNGTFRALAVADNLEDAQAQWDAHISTDESLKSSWEKAKAAVQRHYGGFIRWKEYDEDFGCRGCYELPYEPWKTGSDHLND